MSLRFVISGTDTGIGKTVLRQRLPMLLRPITGSRCSQGWRKKPTARRWQGSPARRTRASCRKPIG